MKDNKEQDRNKVELPSVESDGDVREKVDAINNLQRELSVRKNLILEKAMMGDNPADILKAQSEIIVGKDKTNDNRKSYFIDTTKLMGHGHQYRARPSSVSYHTLQSMARTPIISSIIKTRKNQISQFSKPQKDRFSTGFVIEKKGWDKGHDKLDKGSRKKIDEITEFVLNCGIGEAFMRDDFDTFLRKIVDNSLTFDQDNWENVFARGGQLHSVVAVDPMTIRWADTQIQNNPVVPYKGGGISQRQLQKIGGYYPSYVQIIDERVAADFYAWEMQFGVRNPSTHVLSNGYGRSELEDMISIVTNILNADQYNANFFKLGAAPKGIIRIKGGANTSRVQDFVRQWRAMVAGVDNSWRTPVLDSESMEWIDLQKNNRDMEYGRYQQYLVMLACSIYTISPEEVGFKTEGGLSDKGGNSLFQSNNEKLLQHSTDKGLRPLLRHLEAAINKHIIQRLDSDYELKFVGIDAEDTKEFVERLTKEVQYYRTINEVREEAGLKPLKKGGDIIMSPTYMQFLQQEIMKEQQDQFAGMYGGGGGGEMPAEGGEGGNTMLDQPDEEQGAGLLETSANDMQKALLSMMPKEEAAEELYLMEKAMKGGDPYANMMDETIKELENLIA